ncbi:MAG: CAP domain-containing protein [Chloroflexota bacterium]|nr:CAP domain-containing protein [Chloroflexota bacterium]
MAPVRPPKFLKPLFGCLALVCAALIWADTAGTAYTQPENAPPGNYALARPLSAASAPVRSQYFASTGKTARGDFLTTFQRYGLSRMGYPIEDERTKNGRTMQHFERVRMEQAPDLAGTGRGVTLGLLGVELTQGRTFTKAQPFNSTPTNIYVKETGHSLGELFLSYWKNNGGLALFGYPLSETILEDGRTVQWFERARFEYFPELIKAGRPVQLTLLGNRALEKERQASQPSQPQSPTTPSPGSIPVKLSPDEDYLLKAINDQRAAAGVQPVQIDGAVADIARSRSSDMAERDYFSHTTPDGTNFLSTVTQKRISYRFAGEIIARNNYPDDQADSVAIESYLSSSAHKAIMLDGRFQWAGIGHVRSAEDGMQYYTVIFIQR